MDDTFNPWGWNADDKPEPKGEIFKAADEPDVLYGIEDFLQHNQVFLNGLRNTPCHMDSYMTVVDYKAVDKALKLLHDTYAPTKEDWQVLVDAWDTQPNTQIPAKLVATEVRHLYITPHAQHH